MLHILNEFNLDETEIVFNAFFTKDFKVWNSLRLIL